MRAFIFRASPANCGFNRQQPGNHIRINTAVIPKDELIWSEINNPSKVFRGKVKLEAMSY
jgi:hypothetical protein